MGFAAFDARSMVVPRATILPADTTTRKLLSTGGLAPARLEALQAESDDSAPAIVDVWYSSDGATFYLLGSVSVPAGAGRAGTVATDLFAPLVKMSDGAIFLPTNAFIYVSVEATLTAGKTLKIWALYLVF